MTNPIEDLKIIMSLVMAGGPNGVAEQRIIQSKLTSIMTHLKAQPKVDVEKLMVGYETLIEKHKALEEKHEIIQGEVTDLKTQLRTEKAKVTRLTNKLEKKDVDS